MKNIKNKCVRPGNSNSVVLELVQHLPRQEPLTLTRTAGGAVGDNAALQLLKMGIQEKC